MIAGKDKGKTGKVLQVFADRDRVVVEGVNLTIKHLRPRREGEKGQRVEFPAPLHVSNVMLVCPKSGKATRVSYQVNDKGKKSRYSKKASAAID